MNVSRPSLAFWFTWQCLAAVAIAVIPVRLRFDAIWNLDADTRLLVIGVAIAYLASVTVLTLKARNRDEIGFADLASTFGPVFAGLFLFLVIHPPANVYSRWVILLSLILGAFFAVLPLTLRPRGRRFALPIIVLAILVSLLPSVHSVQLGLERRIIGTADYKLIARYYRNRFALQETGGGISRFGDRYLLATGEGQLYAFRWNAYTEELETRQLPHRVPLNRDEFFRDTPASKIRTEFRTGDILVQDLGADFRLFAAHHYWNSQKHCSTLRVSATDGTYSAFLGAEKPQAWRTVYDSEPCLPFETRSFTGGRLEQLTDGTLLLTLGDLDKRALVTVEGNDDSYGKTVLIDLRTGVASPYSVGHRNPLGLLVDAKGRIWETEHGPQGGDELNLILKGKNYGWPRVSYGRDYGPPVGPPKPSQGRHDGFERPTYAWIPSIGVSSLASVQGNLFTQWKDDLLVGSLVNNSVWRVRVEDGRVIYTERIVIGERIRDLIEDRDGRLILWTEHAYDPPTSGAIVVVEPASNPNLDTQGSDSYR